jgi:hypothetical protein
MKVEIQDCESVADSWAAWCGETQWSKKLRQFGELGGKIKWWCGVPQSPSAIPLCFSLYDAQKKEIEGSSRLKDIRYAIEYLS